MQDLDSTMAAFHQDFKLLAVTLMGKTNLIEINPTAKSTLSVTHLSNIAESVGHGPYRSMLQALLSRTD